MAEGGIAHDLSIHPRNWVGVAGFGPGTKNRKSNTAAPVRGRARKLDRKQKWLNARRNDHALTKSKHHRKIPGSMNDGK